MSFQPAGWFPPLQSQAHLPWRLPGLRSKFGKAGSILTEKIWSQMVLPLHTARMKRPLVSNLSLDLHSHSQSPSESHRKVDHGQLHNPELKVAPCQVLTAWIRPTYQCGISENSHPQQVKGHPNKSFAVTSTPPHFPR